MAQRSRARTWATRGIAVAMVAGGCLTAPGAHASSVVPTAAGDAATAVPNELLVGYTPGATGGQRAAARSRADAQLAERVVPGRSDRAEVELVRFPAGLDRAAAARQLEADPAVAYAEPNWVYTHRAAPNDPYYTNGSLWGMYGDGTSPANQYGSQAGEAWAAGRTGSTAVYVGVIDEGIQFDHPDLAGQVWTNPADPVDGVDNDGNGYVDDVHGWDFAGGDNTVYDGGTSGGLDDHGTHVSGTIAAKADGAGVVGMSWNVTLISGKFLGKRGGTTANAVKAVDYFTDLKTRHGLDIVATNNSWGGGGFSQALLDAITRGARQDILFVAAAGNGGNDGVGDNNDATASYPSNYDTTAGAGYDGVISVAAITSSGAKAGFSNYGSRTVDIGAPGAGIWSTTAYNSYASYNGTSMATPHVTGAVALHKAANPGATASQVKAAILSSAVPTSSLSGRTVTGGRLNASGTAGSTGGGGSTPPTAFEGTVSVSAGAKLKNGQTPVTVRWSGFAGTNVDVTRSGSTLATANDGSLTENWRGSGTAAYTVCETGSSTNCASGSTVI